MEFSGYYNIISIYAEGRQALDLNDDGIASDNLLVEYERPDNTMTARSSFFFFKNNDGGYDGYLSAFIPLQFISVGNALPPYSIETPVQYFGNVIEYAVTFNMKLSGSGEAVWAPALVDEPDDNAQLHVKLLRGAEVRKTENSIIELSINEVPIYDCTNRSLAITKLTYRFEHE
jgi:hypothetical protein